MTEGFLNEMTSLFPSIRHFETHLGDPSPAFRCHAAGDHSEKIKFVARVTNRVEKPGTAKALSVVTRLGGGAAVAALKQFVGLHDGLVLYKDEKSDAAGVEFFRAAQWKSRTQEMRKSLLEMGFEKSELPDWFQSAIVFAAIPQSGNYFAIQPRGAKAGAVFYCDHDDVNPRPFAASFDKLLKMIADDPARFLDRCGSYTRYSDGKTRTQWIPKEYVPDSRGA